MPKLITAISDTHSKHSGIHVPSCDLLIHAGDFSNRGTFLETLDFLDWFKVQPAEHKILICGNHDFIGEQNSAWFRQECENRDIWYLENDHKVIDGISIYGSPFTPTFNRWAFMKNRGPEIANVWDLIPEGLDILITHGPAYGILDKCPASVGCQDLLEAIERTKPAFHIYGHIHEGGGNEPVTIGETTFINASIVNRRLDVIHQPISFMIKDEHEDASV